MTRGGSAFRLTPALLGILIALAAALLPAPRASHAAPYVTTDKADYAPNELVTITGSGFNPWDVVDIVVTRPDDSIVKGDGSFAPGWDTVAANSSGAFTYTYQLNGILGTYTIKVYASPWNGPDSYDVPLATATFTDFTSTTLSINSGAYTTDSLSVTLTVGWSGSGGDPTQARFVNDLTPENDCSDLGGGVWGPWTTVTEIGTSNTATFSWTLATDTSTGYRQVCSEVAQGSLGNPSNKKSAKDQIFYRVPNPSLGEACGFDMVLVIDSSGSIDSAELAQMKAALKSFVSAFLPATPTQIAVVEFDTSSSVTQGFTSNTTVLNNAIDAAASGGYTNWDDALRDARGLFPNRPTNPDVIVFASDGNPNRRGGHTDLGHSGTVSSVTETQAVAWATAEANAAKTAGARIIALGIGSDLDVNNMIAVSGATVSPPAPVNASVDVIKSDFSTLASSLAGLAEGLCGGTITVHKVLDADGNTGTTGDQSNGANWTFSTNVDAPDFSTPASGDTDGSGMINFAIDLGVDNAATVDIIEPGEAGYTFVSASCVKQNNGAVGTPASGAVNNIPVGPSDIINCTFYNTAVTIADIKISSQTVTSPGSATIGAPFTITVNKTLHNNGPATPVTAAITPTLSGPPDCTITPNAGNPASVSLTSSVATPVTESFNVTCSAPSSHQFTVNNCISVTSPGITDPTPGNNCSAPAMVSLPITGTADVKITGITMTGPPSSTAGTPFTVGADAAVHNNGPTSIVNVDTTLTLNLPGDCTTSSANPQVVQDTLKALSVVGNVSGSWNVTCTNPSTHNFTTTATATVDQQHTTDPNTGNNTATSGPRQINILVSSDLKANSVSVSSPASAGVGTPFTVTASASVHNNGNYGPTNADTTFNLSMPGDCTTSSANPQTVQDTSLGVSTATTVSGASWSVTCTTPSSHTFAVSASVAADQLHVSDPNGGNNSASGSSSTNITATSDIKVNSVTVSSPATNAAGVAFNVTASASEHNNGGYGPANVDTTFTLTLPGDCTTSSTNPQTVQNTSLAVSTATTVSGASWSVTCSAASNHTLSVGASAAIDQLHLSDPTSANNSGSGSSATGITASSDIKVNTVTVTSPGSTTVGASFGVSASAGLQNLGGYGPTNVDTTFTLSLPPDCTTSSANPQTKQDTSVPALGSATASGIAWTVTCTSPSSHTFSVTASAAVDQLHVSDPVSGNNSGSGSSGTAVNGTADVKVSGVAVSAPASAPSGAPFSVQVTATLHNNGSVTPVNVDTMLTLSGPVDCTKTPSGSQVIQDSSLATSTAVQVSQTWSVNCTVPSNHSFSAGATAAIDQLHVSDPTPGNDSGAGTATTNITTSSDLKVNSVTVSAPASNAAGTAFNVTASASVHNNGAFGPTNADTTFTLSMPADCTTSSANPQTVQDSSLATSTATTVPASPVSWSVTCTNPSSHSFSATASIAPDQLHVSDPTATNNSASGSASTNITATADIKVNGVSLVGAGTVPAGTPFTVTSNAILHNNGGYGPANVDTTFTLSLPADCTTSSANPQTVQNTSLAVSTATTVPGSPASWSVTCTDPSNHTLTVTASASLDQLHVSDPASANNSASKSAVWSVTRTSDLKVNSVTVSSPASNAAGAPFNVTASASVHNNGAYGPVNADTTFSLSMPADCTTSSANPQTVQDTSLATSTATTVSGASWSVSCTGASSHSFSATASIAVDQLHVSDPTPGNNSAGGGSSTNITGSADIKVNSVAVNSPASNVAGAPFSVTASASVHNNGSYGPANVDTTFTLSLPADCTTSSANPQTVQDTSLATSTATTVSGASWSVTCATVSAHQFQVSASAAVDQLHVSDPTSANNSASGSSTTDIGATSDIKVTGVTVSSPASNAGGSPFNVTATAGLHNNGPYGPTVVDTTFTLTLPGDCTSSSANPQTVQNTSLATSTATTVPGSPASWSVTCSNPSDHTFSVTASAAIDQLHVADPTSANNSASGSSTTSITATTDVKAASVSVTAPASASAGTPFNVSATAVLHNNGPISPANADASFSISLPPDCTTTSGNPQTVQDTSLATSTATTVSGAIWSVTCTTPSNHQFNVTATAAVDQLHLSDSNSANNSAAGNATTDVGSTADIKVTNVTVSAPSNANAGAPFNVTVNATVHNNGPLSPANVDTTFDLTVPGDCTRTPNGAQTVQDSSLTASTAATVSQTWSVTCSNASNHSFTGSATAAEDQLHVDDPNTANNSGSGSGSTAIQASADVKVTGVSTSAPATANAGAAFNVTVTANIHNNGTVNPVNTDTTLDLTVPADCTRTPNGPQVVQDTGLAPSVASPVQATWSVSCSNGSNHSFNGSASVTVDQLHVSDPTSGNNSGSGGATTAVTAQADLKVSSVSVSAPPTVATGTPFNVTVSANLHNNGTATVNADATLSLGVPSDCTKTPNTTQLVDNTALATSTATPVSAVWSVTCTSPSSHQFNGNATVVPDQLHIADPTPTNDSNSGSATTAVTGTADVKVSGVTVSAPASANTSTAFNVTVTATVHNNGNVSPVNADTTLDLTLPTDCTRLPAASQIADNTSLPQSTATQVSKTWSVTCTGQSNHDFSGSASAAIDQQHVSDPNTGNNSASGGPATTAVLAGADLKVMGVSVGAPATAQANVGFNVTVSGTMHNNGTFTPANADMTVSLMTPGDCTKTPNTTQGPQNTALATSTGVPFSVTWTVTCSSGGPHSFQGTAAVTLDEVLHVVDPNTGNNSMSNTGSTNVATPTPTPVPPTPTPSPSPTALGQTATPTPSFPPGGTPVAVGGIAGLIEADGPAPRDSGTSGDSGGMAAPLISAGMLLAVAGIWAARRRLFG